MKIRLRPSPAKAQKMVTPDIGGRIAAAHAKAVEKEVSFKKLLLDPANPRLRKVNPKPTTNYSDPAIQEFVENSMVEMNGRSVAAYYNKMRNEGFIGTLAKIHVASVEGGFLACDGNTRITAIRKLLRDHESKKIVLSAPVLKSFDSIPVVMLGVYGEDEVMLAWNAVRSNMHILSPKNWGPLQKAGFLNHLQKEEGMSIRDIQAMVGGQAQTVRKMLEAFAMFEVIRKDPDYGTRMLPTRFSCVLEAAGNAKVARYLEWDGKKANPTKLRVFAELMAPRDGSKGYLGTGGQLPRLRALGDNPIHWQAALDPKTNKKYLARIESFESGRAINDIVNEAEGKVRKATPEEIEMMDVKIASDLVRGLQKLLEFHAKLVA